MPAVLYTQGVTMAHLTSGSTSGSIAECVCVGVSICEGSIALFNLG